MPILQTSGYGTTGTGTGTGYGTSGSGQYSTINQGDVGTETGYGKEGYGQERYGQEGYTGAMNTNEGDTYDAGTGGAVCGQERFTKTEDRPIIREQVRIKIIATLKPLQSADSTKSISQLYKSTGNFTSSVRFLPMPDKCICVLVRCRGPTSRSTAPWRRSLWSRRAPPVSSARWRVRPSTWALVSASCPRPCPSLPVTRRSEAHLWFERVAKQRHDDALDS